MSNYGSLAQPVEQRTFNPLVARSNRARPTNKIKGLAKSLALFYFLGLRGGYITKLTFDSRSLEKLFICNTSHRIPGYILRE